MQVKGTPRFERMLKRLPLDRQRIVLERASELGSDPYLGKRLTGPLRGDPLAYGWRFDEGFQKALGIGIVFD